jgi:hypothetical protein
MVFNATFNNISAISWRSDLLVAETGVGFELATLLVIGTDKPENCLIPKKNNMIFFNILFCTCKVGIVFFYIVLIGIF